MLCMYVSVVDSVRHSGKQDILLSMPLHVLRLIRSTVLAGHPAAAAVDALCYTSALGHAAEQL